MCNWKFIYSTLLTQIYVYKNNKTFTIISTGLKVVPNETVLALCKDWMWSHNIDEPYEVLVQLL
jgi:hypothetical protein